MIAGHIADGADEVAGGQQLAGAQHRVGVGSPQAGLRGGRLSIIEVRLAQHLGGKGFFTVAGQEVHGLTPREATSLGIAIVHQHPAVLPDMTVLENLQVALPAGVFAEGQAVIAAEVISARIRGAGEAATYDGRGICYLEFGHNKVAKVGVTFVSGQAPTGWLEGPSPALATDKAEFGSSRVKRWFGRTWP